MSPLARRVVTTPPEGGMAAVASACSNSRVTGVLLIKKLMAVIGLLCVAVPAWAQGSWDELPCDQSFLTWDPALKCLRSSASRNAGDPAGAVSSGHVTVGNFNGVTVSVYLSWPVGDGTYLKAYTSESAQRGIKSYSEVANKGASNWGEPRGFGEVTYMTFGTSNRACVGFDQAGPLFEYGYAWRIIGFACKSTLHNSAALDNPEAFLKDVLGALRVGPPGANKNALGAPIRAFTGPGGSS
jgi:hypothetical protein